MSSTAAATRTEKVERHGIESFRFLPESYDEESRTFEVVMSTGASVRRWSWAGPYDEVLSLDPSHIRLERAQSGRMPLLMDHWQRDVDFVVGSVVAGSVRFEGGQMLCRIQMHETEKALEIAGRIQRGELANFSVGYRTWGQEIEEHDDKADVRTATDWEPLEISVVPIPADQGAHTRSDTDAADCVVRSVTDTTMTKTADSKSSSQGDSKPDGQRGDGAKAPEPTPTPEPTEGKRSAPEPNPAELDAARAAGAKLERQRMTAIRSAVTKANLDTEFADGLVERGVTVDQAREEILDELAKTRGDQKTDGKVSVEADAETKSREAIVRALLHKVAPSEHKLEDGDDARAFVGDSLLEIGVRRVEQLGGSVSGLSKTERASAVMNTGSMIRSMHGTSDFPQILAAVVNKRLRDSYRGIARAFDVIVSERTVTDFKEVRALQIGPASKLEPVGEGGEYPRGTIGEAGESYRIGKFGKIIAITRETIINDDLDALSRVPQKMGQQAGLLEARTVWAVLGSNPTMADGLPLFHVNHGNLVTAGLDKAGLNAAYTAMRLQTDIDGDTEIDLMPASLLCPVELRTEAMQLIVLQTQPNSTDQANPFYGSMRIVDTPHLSKFSSSDFYIASSTSQVDMIEMAFLAGNREPYFETRDGFDVDGTEIKVRHEFGVKAIDHRGLVKVV